MQPHMSEAIKPFTLAVPQAELDDLKDRLARTRWPEKETVDDWSQGAPLAKVKALCEHWRDSYDWRRCEAALNGLGQYKTQIDGLGIHFLHIRSPEPSALPMIMTHGWPGSVIEFMKVIGPLTDPVAHGGKAEDAFHLVIPSLPGYGFSDKPSSTGWKIERIAAAWVTLMQRLGYDRFVAQGGDWGAAVTTALAHLRPAGCAAIHLNVAIAGPSEDHLADPTQAEQASMADFQRFQAEESAYSILHGTRPQTLGYGLSDSPAGQAAWVYEKFFAWTDNQGSPEDILSLDEMLDNIMLYWLPGTGTSSARLYWESIASAFIPRLLDFPVGLSIFPREIARPSRRWADQFYTNIIHWNEVERGGHFAAFEQPDLFVNEVRTCFRSVR
jgi:pimeloyl-ACP methyl ester carboxylesterase